MHTFLLASFIYLFYFLPVMVAIYRKHNNVVPILIFNFIFGWTGLGWLLALIWAFSYQEKKV